MDALILIPNLIESFVWIASGVILLAIHSGDSAPQQRAYRMAKRYMAIPFLIGGVSVLLALFVGKFRSGQIEILNIYSLLIFYVATVFMMLSFLSLYNYKGFSIRALGWIFGPVSGLLLLYVFAAIIWNSPSVYSLPEYFRLFGTSPVLIIRTLIFLSILCGVGVVVVRFFRVRKTYREILNDYFSGEEERRRSQWIDRAFAIVMLSYLFVAGSYFTTSLYYDLACGSFLMTASCYLTIRVINYQTHFLRIVPAMEFAAGSIAEISGRSDSAVGILLVQWTSRPDKPYLAPGLSLGDLSQMTGVSKRRLSEHINGRFNMTFTGWINSLRIREVERMLSDINHPQSLSDIAIAAGYADLAAMSNAFKKIQGISLSRFRQLLQE